MRQLSQNAPSFGPEKCLNPLLLDVGVLLLEVVRETEGYDRQPSLISLDIFVSNACDLFKIALVTCLDVVIVQPHGSFDRPYRSIDFPVDIAQHCIVPRMFQSPTKKPGIFHVCKGDRAVSFETKVDEVEVLCNDGCSWTGKIKGEGIFNGTKIMQLEYKILGKVGFVSPDYPSNTNIAESKLVAAEIKCQHNQVSANKIRTKY